MNQWIADYVKAQKAALDSIPVDAVANLIKLLKKALHEERHIFVFGNGGSASNASHFVTDLGKGASDKVGKRFRVLSLNDNVSWMTAIGNDYSYEDVFVRQLEITVAKETSFWPSASAAIRRMSSKASNGRRRT